jgi:chromosome segregation ATPase
MTFSPSAALTLAAEAEDDERNATPGPWTVPQGNRLLGAVSANIDGLDRQVASACGQAPQFEDVPDVAKRMSDNALAISRMRNRNPQVASMLRAAVARVEELEAETRAVRMTEADLVRMPMSDLDHHKAELLAMLTDRDSLRAKLAEVEADRDKWRHIAKVQDEKAHAFLEQRDSARRELGRLGDKRREAEHRASRAEANAREYMSQLAASRVDLSQAEAALGEMTKARDEACRLLEGCTNELAEHEDDPSMLDGHRTRITELRSVGKENP